MHNIKNITLLTVLLLFVSKTYSQNKQILYDFAELPQTLLLNPGTEVNYKFHAGVPLLSGISTDFGIKGFTVFDLFNSYSEPINDRVSSILRNLNAKDHFKFNVQIEVLNGGFRYRDKNYFSFGFYEEIDGIFYFPKDLMTLATEGNSAYLNKNFDLSQVLYKIDALGVLHFGMTRNINEKLTVGARFKIYSSALNLESTNNSGTFTTVDGTNNIYTHHLDNVNVNLKTSGLVDGNDEYVAASSLMKNTFLGGNMGLGFDIGFTYHASEQLEFTGSIVDFGFINHKKNIKNTFVKGSFSVEGLKIGYDSENYWEGLKADFEEKITSGDTDDSYVSWRPAKFNASVKYSFGERRSKQCYDEVKDFYSNAFGAQLYSIFRPLSPQLALTGFFERSFSEKLHAKVTYTIDDYSFYNIGFGLSAQIGKVNFYGMVDNITQLNDIAAARGVSLQLGINLIF